MTFATVLANNSDYRITLHQYGEAPTEKLLVTFGGQPSDLADAGFGTDFAAKLGIDSLFVAQSYGSQYQGLSVKAFKDAVNGVVSQRDVISYGSSLGAYAALYFGGCIDARIIAAAPMLPAWPPLKNRAYSDLKINHLPLVDVPRSSRSPVVIYDPLLDRDAFLVNEMVRPAYPKLREVHVPYGGHTVLVTLSRLRSLKPLVTGLIENDELVEIAVPQEGDSIYHAERGRHIVRQDLEGAIAEYKKSLSIAQSKRVYCMLFSAILRAGKLAEAQEMIDRAKETDDKQIKLVPSLLLVGKQAGLDI